MRVDKIAAYGVRLSIVENDLEKGRAFLYVMQNDLHKRPFGLMEDVWVSENCRGQGIGTKLINAVKEKAKELDCYKLIATSRHSRQKVHKLYDELGFTNHGFEFRINL